MVDRDGVFCLLLRPPWISVVTSGDLSPALGNHSLQSLDPARDTALHGTAMGLSDVRYKTGQKARSMDSELRLGTLVTFFPQKILTRGFPLHLGRPVNQSILVTRMMPLREWF